MNQLGEALVNLFKALGDLAAAQQDWLLPALLLLAWLAWWLWGVHWPTMWQRLGEGAWAPLVLLLLLTALVWSQLAPSNRELLALGTVPNFWWQLGALGLLLSLAFFCGWIQGKFGWTPAEINLAPPAHGHDHDHGHGHDEHAHGTGQPQGAEHH